jgi:hypothetical protein
MKRSIRNLGDFIGSLLRDRVLVINRKEDTRMAYEKSDIFIVL